MDDLFQAEKAEVQIDPEKDYLPELVGEGKKFKSPQDLARSVLHKDAHISRTERENAELREELKKRMNMEDFMSKLTDTQKSLINQPVNSETPSVAADKKEIRNEQEPKSFSEEDVLNILKREENKKTVRQTLQAAYGDQMEQRVLDRGKELGLGPEFLQSLALSQPKAFLALMNIDGSKAKEAAEKSIFSPARPSINTQQLGNPNARTDGRKTLSQWEAIRKSSTNLYNDYFSEKAAMQRMNDAIALKNDFFDK